jgi:integrase
MAASLVGQIEWLFEQHRGTGESRRAWRDQHPGFGQMAPTTFSWKSERRYKGVACQFAKWARQHYGIKQVRDLRTEMVMRYIGERVTAGLSPRTLATDITALRRLGMYAVAVKWIERNFVPEELSIPHGSHPRFSYAPAHAQAIIAYVQQRDPRAAEVLRVQLAAGLRIDEAIKLRTDKVDFERGTMCVKGKGGRTRTVEPQDKSVLAHLEQSRRFPLLHGREDAWTRKIQRLVRQACEELGIEPIGTHGLRATAAQNMYDEELDGGTDDRAARPKVAKFLGHNRTDVTKSYVP